MNISEIELTEPVLYFHFISAAYIVIALIVAVLTAKKYEDTSIKLIKSVTAFFAFYIMVQMLMLVVLIVSVPIDSVSTMDLFLLYIAIQTAAIVSIATMFVALFLLGILLFPFVGTYLSFTVLKNILNNKK